MRSTSSTDKPVEASSAAFCFTACSSSFLSCAAAAVGCVTGADVSGRRLRAAIVCRVWHASVKRSFYGLRGECWRKGSRGNVTDMHAGGKVSSCASYCVLVRDVVGRVLLFLLGTTPLLKDWPQLVKPGRDAFDSSTPVQNQGGCCGIDCFNLLSVITQYSAS